jgi:hypothetical protein
LTGNRKIAILGHGSEWVDITRAYLEMSTQDDRPR